MFQLNEGNGVFALREGGSSERVDLDISRTYTAGEHVHLRPDASASDARRETLSAEVLADMGDFIAVRTDHPYWPRPGVRWFDRGESMHVPRRAILGFTAL